MKKLRQRIIIFILGCLLLGVGIILYDIWKENRLEKHVINEYSMEISYPCHYSSIQKEEPEEYTSRVKIAVSGEDISQEMKSLNMSENIIHVKSEKRKMRLLVDALKTTKASLDLDEICRRYIVMFRVYNEELSIKESRRRDSEIRHARSGKS